MERIGGEVEGRPRSRDDDLEALRIPPEEPARRGGRWLTLALLGAGTLIFLLGLLAWDRWPVGGKAVAVAQASREQGGGPTILAAGGYIAPKRMATVGAKVPGTLVHLAVRVGDRVEEGDLLARLEDREFRAQVERARTNLAVAQANLARLRAGSRPEEIQRAEAELRRAQANLQNAEQRLKRPQELYQEGAISVQELDDARTQHDAALAQVRVAQENLALAREGTRPEDIAVAEAQVRLAEKELEVAEAQLDNTVIRAPFAGVVIDQKANVGDMLFPGEPEFILPGMTQVSAKRGSTIVRLADLSEVFIQVDLNEGDLGKVRIGQRATVIPDAASERTYEGKVVSIYPMADRQKKTIPVYIKVEKPDRFLIPEAGARVNFLGETLKGGNERAVLIPSVALIGQGEDSAVFVVKDSRASRRKVRVGQARGEQVEVLSGLEGGEWVVVEGQDRLRDGERVSIKRR